MWKKTIVFVLTAVVSICIILLFLDEEKSYSVKAVSFNNGETRLVGSLTLPKINGKQHPCIIFVHGAQDMPRDGYGYYKSYWQEFAKEGFCSLSWDKPGVGDSTGDWHNQSMRNRAEEVLSAIQFLKSRGDVDIDKIGLIGFSQAGWVLPLTASMSKDVKYIIPISGAINWISQGNLVEENLLKEKNLTQKQIDTDLRVRHKVNALLQKQASYDEYLSLVKRAAPETFDEPINRLNWNFYKLNIDTDAKKSLSDTKCPVLAIFGENDIYIDVEESMRVYKSQLSTGGNVNFKIVLFPHSDHGMMRSNSKRFSHKGFQLYWNIFKWEILGKNAFPDGYFETILGWSKKQVI